MFSVELSVGSSRWVARLALAPEHLKMESKAVKAVQYGYKSKGREEMG